MKSFNLSITDSLNLTKWLWLPLSSNLELGKKLFKHSGINPFLLNLLINKGYTNLADIRDYLYPEDRNIPPPEQFRDIQCATEIIIKAIKNKRKILIYGHDDIDGFTSTLCLLHTLKKINKEIAKDIFTFIPNRTIEGHGINSNVLKRFVEEKGINLLITVDCGVSNAGEIQKAKDLGLEVIITDHHLIANGLPPADAIVNPKRADEIYPFPYLAGVGVVYNLVQVLLKHLPNVFPDFHWTMEDQNFIEALVGLGTISDKVPLVKVNRSFVKMGLVALSQTKNPALLNLKKYVGLTDIIKVNQIAERIVPLLSSASSDNGYNLSLEVLQMESYDDVYKILSELEKKSNAWKRDVNNAFHKLHKKILDKELWKENIIILEDYDISMKLLGSCATRLTYRLNRPILIIGINERGLVAEARGPKNFNFIDAFNYISKYLLQFGGHRQAAGFSTTKENVSHIKRELKNYINSLNWTPKPLYIRFDAKLSLEQITPDLLKQLELLEPYGAANSTPIFYSQNIQAKWEIRNYNLYGKYKDWDIIGYNKNRDWHLPPKNNLDILYSINGNSLILKDFQVSPAEILVNNQKTVVSRQ